MDTYTATAVDELHRVREELAKRDFAITSDDALGLPSATRRHIADTYFAESVLEGDNPAVHQDRDRARDVIRYGWDGDDLTISEHDTVAIRNRSGFTGERTPTRTLLVGDELMAGWIRAVLGLVPAHLRQAEGTFGVNFLRTRTNIVSGPHQDDEQYVLIYVADKIGTGGESTLHMVGEPDKILYRRTLKPGELIIFRDEAFLHNASPLINPASGPARRDAVVCTVNYPDTYQLG